MTKLRKDSRAQGRKMQECVDKMKGSDHRYTSSTGRAILVIQATDSKLRVRQDSIGNSQVIPFDLR